MYIIAMINNKFTSFMSVKCSVFIWLTSLPALRLSNHSESHGIQVYIYIIILPFPESPDCYFEDGSCGWAGEEDWEIKISKENSKDNLLLL